MSSSSGKGHSSDEKTIHSGQIDSVYDVPLSAIHRPIVPVLDEKKVASLMETISDDARRDEDVPPVDVMWITSSSGNNYFFATGGCHRFAAHERLGKETIRAKLIKTTEDNLRVFMGGSTPVLK